MSISLMELARFGRARDTQRLARAALARLAEGAAALKRGDQTIADRRGDEARRSADAACESLMAALDGAFRTQPDEYGLPQLHRAGIEGGAVPGTVKKKSGYPLPLSSPVDDDWFMATREWAQALYNTAAQFLHFLAQAMHAHGGELQDKP